MTLEELKVLITTETKGLKADLANVKKEFNAVEKEVKASTSSISKAFGVVKVAVAALGIVQLAKSSISAASNLKNAMMGLHSIVTGQGRSFSAATKFIQEYIDDGLIPLTNAVTAYKNLASRGYTDDQIQTVLTRLKDAAAFGRQASYSLGDAVTSATEGLKNENSILVDNAGVTKNVAKMWDEYAKSIGKNAQQLSQQEKIQAEVAGIMKETQFQVGDAAKLTDEYSGKVSKLGKTFTDIKVNIGQSFISILSVVLPVLQTVADAIARITAYIAQFMQALFGASKSQESAANSAAKAQTNLGNATAATGDKANKAGKEAKGALAGFDEINQLDLSKKDSGSVTDTGAGSGLTTPDVSGVLDAGITETKTKIQGLVDSVKGILGKVFEPFKTAWENHGVGVTEEFNRAIEGTKNTLLNFGVLMGSIWGAGGSKLLENITALGLEIGKLGLKIYNDFILPVVNWFINFLNPETNKATKAVIDGLNWLLVKTREFVQYLSGDGFIYVQTFLGLFTAWKSAVFVVEMAKATAALVAHTAAIITGKAETIYLSGLYAKDFVVNIGRATAGIIANTSAKTKDIAETGILIALYAKDAVAKGVSTAATWAQTTATTAWNIAAGVAATVTTALGAAFAFLTSPIGLVVLAITGLIAAGVLLYQNWDVVKAKSIEVWGPVSSYCATVAEKLKSIWNGLKQTASDAWNSIWSVIKGVMNSMIGAINKFIEAWNSIKLNVPEVNIPFWGKVGGFTISVPAIPTIPKLARGGIVDQPTLAMIGEAGKEAVVPLENTSFVNTLASALGSAVITALQLSSGNNQSTAENITVELYMDTMKVGRAVLPKIDREAKRMGFKPILRTT